MQLFLCPDFQVSNSQFKVYNNPELVRQLRKVLRAQPGYQFYVQSPEGKIRYHLQLQKRSDTEVFAELLSQIQAPLGSVPLAMAIALPNKQEKLELIIQKLTEIGVSHIYLRSSERSVLKHYSPQKMDRLYKIMIEALEQSRGWAMPKVSFISDFSTLLMDYQVCIFDLPTKQLVQQNEEKSDLPWLGIIGPEGGLTIKDYQRFGENSIVRGLGDQVLRMETAAIIGARLLKNSK